MKPLEERLHAHLGADASTNATDGAGLGAVKKLARRRSLQTRVVAGAFGLAALAGLASLVPTGQTTDSLITATEPTPDTQQVDDSAEPEGAEAPEPTPAPDATGPRPVTEPSGYGVVTDGQGGFVARKFPSSQGRIQFVRSPDGETWFDAEEAQLPDRLAVEQLRFEDGFFVLELERNGRNAYPNLEPLLAISEDLVTWDIIDLGLGPDDVTGPQTVDYGIGEIAINGEDVAVVVLEFNDINYAHFDISEQDVCALIDEPAATVIVLCDGTLLTSEAVVRPELVQHLLVSRSGAPATELVDFEPAPATAIWDWSWRPATLIPQENSFVVAEYQSDPATFVNADTAAELAELGDPQLVTARSAAGRTLLVVETGEGPVTVLTPPTRAIVAETIGRLPTGFGQRAARTSYSVGHGPAGWTITVYEQGVDLIEVERDGWQFWGEASWGGARIRSVGESEEILFNAPLTGLPPGVRVSLFGGVRYFHPVTGELLIELTAEEATPSAIEALEIDQATFDRTIEVDGWTIGGHPLYGPLTLTSPTGVVTEYRNGFAFDNDDISDGVETDIGSAAFGDFALQRAGIINFYDDEGNEVISVRGRDLFRDLVEPVLTLTDESGEPLLASIPSGFQQDATVLHSVDGTDWEVIWASDPADDGQASFLTNLAVGDDEILLATPLDLVRIPIDD